MNRETIRLLNIAYEALLAENPEQTLRAEINDTLVQMKCLLLNDYIEQKQIITLQEEIDELTETRPWNG